MEPLLEYIEEVQQEDPGGYVTVILPEFLPHRLWQHLLHNQHALLIKGALLFKPNIVVTSVPYHLGRAAPRARRQRRARRVYDAGDRVRRATAGTAADPSLTAITRNSATSYGCSSLEPRLERRDPIAGRLDHELLLAILLDAALPPINRRHRPAGRSRTRRGVRRQGRAQMRRHRSSRRASSGRLPERHPRLSSRFHLYSDRDFGTWYWRSKRAILPRSTGGRTLSGLPGNQI